MPENIYFYDIDVRNELMIYGLRIESETSMSIFYGRDRGTLPACNEFKVMKFHVLKLKGVMLYFV